MTPYGVALEITPPARQRAEVLLRRARLLGSSASTVHVIQRPGRQTSLDASIELEDAGVSAVWHVTNRGRASAEIDAEIARAAESGVKAALVVRGEAGPPDGTDTPTLRTIAGRIRTALPFARVGVTLNPYLDPERSLANLWPKLDAGATFVQTQPIFEVSTLQRVAERIRARAPDVSIVPMVIPVVSAASAEKLALRLRVPLPDAFVAKLVRGGTASGFALFEATLDALRASGLADGVAVMTQEMDPPAVFGDEIRRTLHGCGWLRGG